MSRRVKSGGGATRRSKTRAKDRRPRPEDIDPDAIDPEAPEYVGVDWENLEQVHFQLDPALVERIRARRALRQITLRIGEEQIAEARRVAQRIGAKYQAVLR